MGEEQGEGSMTTSTITCARGEPQCHRPDCDREAALQCDYRLDHWGRTCDAWMCREHALAIGFGRDHCMGHLPPKEQGRLL